DVLSQMASSLGLADRGEPVDIAAILERFRPAALPRDPWILTDDEWS
ncbi:tRNA glutamyl-Q(34) synthetase GluQRS, partial [Streptomyces sp. SID10244]|nr:tRNA glutamyl-Q(34) synthetase GluQRS [Streptomyces sp. SID10244]